MQDSSRRHRRPRRSGSGQGGQGGSQGQQNAGQRSGGQNSGGQRSQGGQQGQQRPQGQRPQGQQAQGGQPRPPGSGQRRRRRRGGNSGRPLSGPQVVQKYLNLLEQHITNRRKYFEYYDREDGRHRRRLEKNFFASVEQLRRFEEKLQEWQKEHLKLHVDRYRLDTTYTGNRSIPTEAEPVSFEGNFEDPHFTESQQEAFTEYAEDVEESSGSYDDYLAYKASK